LDIGQNGEHHLGYSRTQILNQSWYSLVHPEDTAEAVRKHTELIQSGMDAAISVYLRMQTSYGHFIWTHIVMRLGTSSLGLIGSENSPQQIVCLNQVMDEREATEMRSRENLEEIIEIDARGASLETVQFRDEAYLPTVVVDDGFLDQASSGVKSPGCDRQELLKKIRCKAQEKKSKKAKISEFNPAPSYDFIEPPFRASGSDALGMNKAGLCNLAHQSTSNLLAPPVQVDSYCSEGYGYSPSSSGQYFPNPLTPPYSDDGSVAEYASASYYVPTPEYNRASCTPPYSPPNSFSSLDEITMQSDESSFFDGSYRPLKSAVVTSRQDARPKVGPDGLPELDQCLVEDYFQNMECYGKPVQTHTTHKNVPVYHPAQPGAGCNSTRVESFSAKLNGNNFGSRQLLRESGIDLSRQGLDDMGVFSNDVSYMDLMNNPLFDEEMSFSGLLAQAQF